MIARVTIELTNAYQVWDVDVPDGVDEEWVRANLYGPDTEFIQMVDSGGNEEVTEIEVRTPKDDIEYYG